MNKSIRIAIGAMAICGSVLMGGGFVSAAENGSDIKDLIPNTITLSVNEIEYTKGGENLQEYRFGKTVNALVEDNVKNILTTNGATFSDVTAGCGDGVAFGSSDSFYTCDLLVLSGTDSVAKSVTLQYANTSNTNATAKATLQAKIDAVADNGIIRTEHLYPDGVTVDFIKNEQSKFFTEAERIVQNIIGESGYTVYVDKMTTGGDAQGVDLFISPVFIYKGDELYAITKIVPKYNTYSNATTTKTEIAEDDSVYTELSTYLTDKGYIAILGAYELKTSGNSSRFFLSFDVDSRYNGKTVVVLHKIADGNYEEFERTVKDGKVEVETSSLSPFMIATKETPSSNTGSNAGSNSGSSSITNNGSNSSDSSTDNKTDVAGTPNTGVATGSDGSHVISAILGSVIFGIASCAVAAFFTGKKILARKKEQKA